MRHTEYQVSEVEADIKTDIGEKTFVASGLDFEVVGPAEYNEEIGALVGDFIITLTFNEYTSPAANQDSDENDEDAGEIGEAQVTMSAFVGGKEEEFEEYLETWEKEGYRDISTDFRYHIEAGMLSQVFAPLDHLFDGSIVGVLPTFMFSNADEERYELDSEEQEELREELDEIEEEIVELYQRFDPNITQEDIAINIAETFDIEADDGDEEGE